MEIDVLSFTRVLEGDAPFGVSTADLQQKEDGRWVVVRMVTDKAHEGQGFGREVLEMVRHWADGRGVPVFVDEYGDKAAFYKKCGFARDDAREALVYRPLALQAT